MSRLIQYLKDTRGEMKHVSWPTRRQATVFTILVIFISLLTAAYLGLFDFILTRLLDIFFV
ncbi:MAG: preprotein translocase subunit SecE [Parcubacteria group bacterium]|nr:preprotein translocase subunit SecE [Parcubacteria group bacterium]